MAAFFYGKYVLLSRPYLDEKLGAWMPYASVSWHGDEKSHYRQFNELGKTFATEEQALAYGFIVARRWIREHQPD